MPLNQQETESNLFKREITELPLRYHHIAHWANVLDLWYNGDFQNSGNTSRLAPGDYSREAIGRELYTFCSGFAQFQKELHIGRQLYQKRCIDDYGILDQELTQLGNGTGSFEVVVLLDTVDTLLKQSGFVEIFDTDLRAQDLEEESQTYINIITEMQTPDDIQELVNEFGKRSADFAIPLSDLGILFHRISEQQGFERARSLLRAVFNVGTTDVRSFFRLAKPAELHKEIKDEIEDAQEEYEYEVDLVGDISLGTDLADAFGNRVFFTTYKFLAAAHAAPATPVVISSKVDDICASCQGRVHGAGSHCNVRVETNRSADYYFCHRLSAFAVSQETPQHIRDQITVEDDCIRIPVGLLVDKEFLQAFFDTTNLGYNFS